MSHAHKGLIKQRRTTKLSNRQGETVSLTQEIQDKICFALRAGNFRTTAAAYAGVPERTFFEWMKRGRDKNDKLFKDFRRAVVEAEKAAEVRAVALVMRAAEADAKHAEWWLSHRWPEKWADQERKRIRAEIKHQKLEMSVNLDHVTLDDVRAVLGDKARASLTEGSGNAENLLGEEAPDVDP